MKKRHLLCIVISIIAVMLSFPAFGENITIVEKSGTTLADLIVANNTYYSTTNTNGSEPGPTPTTSTVTGIGGKAAGTISTLSVVPAIPHGDDYVKGNNHKQYIQLTYSNSKVGEGYVVIDMNVMPLNNESVTRVMLQPNAGTSISPQIRQANDNVFNIGQWNHIRYVMQPSTANETDGYGYTYIYVNGKLLREGRSSNTYNSSYKYPKRLMFDATSANDSVDLKLYFDDLHAYISDTNPGAQAMPSVKDGDGYTVSEKTIYVSGAVSVSDIVSDNTVKAFADSTYTTELEHDTLLTTGNMIIAFNGIYMTYYSVVFDPNSDITASEISFTSLNRQVSCSTSVAYTGGGTKNILFIAASYKGGRLLEADAVTKSTGDKFVEFNTTLKEIQGATYKAFTLDAETLAPVTQTAEKQYTSLDGKKIIFIGNSLVYYGQTVLNKSSLAQSVRNNDTGYFYQLCKENGENVSVTNWTFGSHTLIDTFGGKCSVEKAECYESNHLDNLTDRYFDYVVISSGSWEDEELFPETLEMVMNIFKEANPDAKFILLSHHRNYTLNKTGILNYLKTAASKGITVVDWGALVMDIINGITTVPGGSETYNTNSFIIQKSAADGYHPNLLTGYITTLMTYSAITGKNATGQPYAFCNDSGINKFYDFENFISTYYIYDGATTNFDKVFASPTDMKGIQQLIDRYLDAAAWKNYNFSVTE